MLTVDEIAEGCDLSRWAGDPARCRWCDTTLTGLGPFCSALCRADYRVNHLPAASRQAALARGHWSCALCWRGPAFGAVLRCLGVDVRRLPAETAALVWEATVVTAEVDHTFPLWGEPRRTSCANHQANLRVLCHDCHRSETLRWRRVRAAFKRAFDVDIGAPPDGGRKVPVAA